MKNLDSNFEKIISNPDNWYKFQSLMNVAAELVNDFDQFGEVLQSNDDDNVGVYDQNSTIERLRGAIISVDNDIIRYGDYLPHLTKPQQVQIGRAHV